jgi:hypothetical protein
MSESKKDMQNQLNVFNDFCKKWKLKVNAEKSKVLVFSNGRLPANLKFTYNNRDWMFLHAKEAYKILDELSQ